jgi:hypothetical protein
MDDEILQYCLIGGHIILTVFLEIVSYCREGRRLKFQYDDGKLNAAALNNL